jgi:hypothetical protein
MTPAGLLILLGVAALIYVSLRWLANTPSHLIADHVRRAGIFAVVAFVLFLTASGRLPLLFAVVGAALAMLIRVLYVLQFIPLLQQIARHLGVSWPSMGRGVGGPGSARSANAKESAVQSRFVRMSMDHRSGTLRGEVLEGRFAGRQLNALNLHELIQLLAECQSDAESAALVQAYLERVHGHDWQSRAHAREGQQQGATSGSKMGTEEAYQVLGLKPGSSKQEIIAAHRRLMQKLHPDRGGSDYLAAKLNQAKDVLLGT